MSAIVCRLVGKLTSTRELEDVFFQYHRDLVVVQFEPLVAFVSDPAQVVPRGARTTLMSQHRGELIQATVAAARICM